MFDTNLKLEHLFKQLIRNYQFAASSNLIILVSAVILMAGRSVDNYQNSTCTSKSLTFECSVLWIPVNMN